RVAEETPGPFEGVGWTVGETGNLCGNLGYLFLETEGGTASSPTKVLLYHHGEQVATQPADDVRVLLGGHSDFHVALRFQEPLPEAAAQAGATCASSVYARNPFAGDGDAMPIGPPPPGIDIWPGPRAAAPRRADSGHAAHPDSDVHRAHRGKARLPHV